MKALIFGITGQTGSYLAEILLSQGCQVHGVIRRSSSFNTGRIDHIFNQLNLHYGDITDYACVSHVITSVKPDKIFNLAAQSHVAVSFEMPLYTGQVDALGTLNIIDACHKYHRDVKILQASTSELYGKNSNVPQNESTAFHPASPYGVAKLYAYWAAKNYRESYGMFVSNSICFNHESERRGLTFVTRKITSGLAAISRGIKTTSVELGNIYSKRDWGHAKDYAEGIAMILDHDKPDDFVLATGHSITIKEFCEKAAIACGFGNIYWTNNEQEGYCSESGKHLFSIKEKYFRPNEVDHLQGDYSKIKNILGWEPKINIDELIRLMVDNEFKIIN